MLFSDLPFVYMFLPLVMVLYFVHRSLAWRNGLLLAFSLFFYSWGEPRYLLAMLAMTLVSWGYGIWVARLPQTQRGQRRALLVAAVCILVGNLLVFKYCNFFTENICALLGTTAPWQEIALPIGISFYTFQILSYVVDLYRGKVAVQRNLFYFALYVSFFPQLIAGPIVRYQTIEQEINSRTETWDDVVAGLRRFVVGLGKKVLIANNMAVLADTIYGSAAAGSAAYWLAALCYTLQIYFDFSGYSDMAIGMGRIFGFHFLENFNYPYIARSVTDFWRRWHISLSSWFRDYVYIPLGGNRVSKPLWVRNILVVWLLTGFWHGAEWNFILWGLYYAVLLLAEKLFLQRLLQKLTAFVQWLYAMFLVMVGWVIFTLTDLAQLGQVLKEMFLFTPTDWAGLFSADASLSFALLFLPLGVLFSFPVAKKIRLPEEKLWACVLVYGAFTALLAVCIVLLISSAYNPFIYFRF